MEAAPVVDLHDPRLRYRLITINNDDYALKAYMKDLLLKESRFVKAGETIGDCKLTEIIFDKMSVRLKPTTGSEFILKQSTPVAKR